MYPFFLDLRQAAIDKDLDALIALKQAGACIDEQHYGLSPAADLAGEGNTEAATFLVEQGANPHAVAYAAAAAGDLEYALFLHREYGADIAQIGMGAEFAGLPLEEVIALEKRGAPLGAILCGACRKGDVARIDYWQGEAMQCVKDERLLITGVKTVYMNMILGASLAGNAAYRDELIGELRAYLPQHGIALEEDHPNLLEAYYHSAAQNPAEFSGGRLDLFSEAQQQEIALGALRAREFTYLYSLLDALQHTPEDLSALLQRGITVLLECGNYPAIQLLIERYPASSLNAATLATVGVETGRMDFTYQVCHAAGLSPRELKLTSKTAEPLSLLFPAKFTLLQTLSHIPDGKFSCGLAQAIQDKTPDKSRQLLNKAGNLRTGQLAVMHKYHLSPTQAEAWARYFPCILSLPSTLPDYNLDITLRILALLAPLSESAWLETIQKVRVQYPEKFKFFSEASQQETPLTAPKLAAPRPHKKQHA